MALRLLVMVFLVASHVSTSYHSPHSIRIFSDLVKGFIENNLIARSAKVLPYLTNPGNNAIGTLTSCNPLR